MKAELRGWFDEILFVFNMITKHIITRGGKIVLAFCNLIDYKNHDGILQPGNYIEGDAGILGVTIDSDYSRGGYIKAFTAETVGGLIDHDFLTGLHYLSGGSKPLLHLTPPEYYSTSYYYYEVTSSMTMYGFSYLDSGVNVFMGGVEYCVNGAATVNLTMPANNRMNERDKIRIRGRAGGWKIVQIASQHIHLGAYTTTTGSAGYIASTSATDCIELACNHVDAGGTESEWVVVGFSGVLELYDGTSHYISSFGQDLRTTGDVTFNSLALTTSLDETDGGTGTSTYTTGDVLYASGANTLSKLPIGTSGQVLLVSGGMPSWGAGLSADDFDDGTYGNIVFDGVTGGGVPDSYTKALYYFNGIDGGTTITDEIGVHNGTCAGSANTDTAQKKMGSASLLLDGNGDYVDIGDSTDYYFDGDFTIDFFVRFASVPVDDYCYFFSQTEDASNYMLCLYDSRIASGSENGVDFIFRIGASWYPGPTNTGLYTGDKASWSADTWYHVEVGRSGNNWYIFKNGTLMQTVSNAIAYPNLAGNFLQGIRSTDTTKGLNGWIDCFRISKGICRHTTGFTAPTTEDAYKTLGASTIIYGQTQDAEINHNALLNTHNLTTDIHHGGTTGLGDDDHTQYLLTNGTRDLSGNWAIGSNNITLATGSIGLGTTTPDRKIEILDVTNPQLRLTQADASKYADVGVDSNGNISFYPLGTERIRILSGGTMHISNTGSFGTSTGIGLGIRWASGVTDGGRNNTYLFDSTPLAASVGGGFGMGGIINATPSYKVFGSVWTEKDNATTDEYGAKVFIGGRRHGNVIVKNLTVGPDGITIGSGETGIDYALTFNGETNDGIITWQENENTFYFDKRIEIPGNTSNSSLQTGGFELQSYATNNCWLGNNLYFDGGSWRYRANGTGATQYFTVDGFQVQTAPNGNAGDAATNTSRFVVGLTGNFAIGGSITSGSDFTGATIVGSSGNVYIGKLTGSEKLSIHGSIGSGTNGAGGIAGSLVLYDGANPGTTATISYTKWADLEAVNGYVKCNGSGNYSATVTIPTGEGGTGLTSFTANGVVYASSTSALATGTGLTWTSTVLTSTSTSNNAAATIASIVSGDAVERFKLIDRGGLTLTLRTATDEVGSFVFTTPGGVLGFQMKDTSANRSDIKRIAAGDFSFCPSGASAIPSERFRMDVSGNFIMTAIADTDTYISIVGTSSTGYLYWMEDEDYFKFSDDVLMSSTENIYFRDTAISINSATDGHLDLTTDISIDMNGLTCTQNVQPLTDDTYYLGKNDDDTPSAYKGVILKDTTNGKYYRIEVINGIITATDLTD